MKLFNKRKVYVYLVAYKCGVIDGDIEIASLKKLDSYDELKTTRKVITENIGEKAKDLPVVITNVVFLKREYRDKWW